MVSMARKNKNLSKDMEFWAIRAKNYNKLEWTTKSEYLKKFLDAGNFSKDDVVLDVGTGTGIIAKLVSPHVKKVVGIDISPDMINQANGTNNGKNAEFILNDACNLQFEDETFDKITARMSFHHITKDTLKAMQECHRVLKRGGMVIFSEGVPPDKSVKERYEEIFKLKEDRITFFEEDMQELMEQAGFKVVNVQLCIQKQASLNNWLCNSGLPPETIEKIRILHTESDDNFKKVYNMRITEDNDVFMDWKFIIMIGVKEQ
jgi:ubiquinone/menaquinone biosynthesis C-methylase UbiE